MLCFAQIERIVSFTIHINAGGYNIICRGKSRGDLIGIEQTPVFEVCIAIGEENVDQQSSGKLLCISQSVTRKLVKNSANLFVVGSVIFLT